MTRSEQFVHGLAESAFLSLWTYPNPIVKAGKELCDVLVVCRPDIAIMSVKEVELRMDGDRATQIERWKRRAVDESVEQIYGAQRRLSQIDSVMTADGERGVDLGPPDQRRIHRVAVAIGAGGSVPLESKDVGKGFVHVFDEDTLHLLLTELDTITDFVEYLNARQTLLTEGYRGVLIGSEADLLAAFLLGDHSFRRLIEGAYDVRIVAGTWDDFTQSQAYKGKKEADKVSYAWDRLIRQVHDDYASGNMEFGEDLASIDAITRIMARESRLYRRALGACRLWSDGRDEVGHARGWVT